MKFNNKPNFIATSKENGEIYWISRSVSVDIIFIIKNKINNQHYVLMVKRGKGVNDSFKWSLVCGYLDWDEQASDGMVRELFEEVNINLPEIVKCNKVIIDYTKIPFYINSDIDNPKQNIALGYAIYMVTEGFPETSKINNEPDEVDTISWIEIDSIINNLYPVAFNHEKRIKEFYEYIPKTNCQLFKKWLLKILYE